MGNSIKTKHAPCNFRIIPRAISQRILKKFHFNYECLLLVLLSFELCCNYHSTTTSVPSLRISLLLKKLLLSILKKITTHNYTTKFLPVVVQNLARICLSIIALWLPPSHIIKMHSSSLKQQQQRHLSTINNIPYMSLKIFHTPPPSYYPLPI